MATSMDVASLFALPIGCLCRGDELRALAHQDQAFRGVRVIARAVDRLLVRFEDERERVAFAVVPDVGVTAGEGVLVRAGHVLGADDALARFAAMYAHDLPGAVSACGERGDLLPFPRCRAVCLVPEADAGEVDGLRVVVAKVDPFAGELCG